MHLQFTILTIFFAHANMNVLLLKEPRDAESGSDPYITELNSIGVEATLIPVLSFRFLPWKTLSAKLFQPEQHGGLIFTSPRSVEAVKACLETSGLTAEWNQSVRSKWNNKSIYVIGKSTAALVRDLGLEPRGEDSGTAETLSRTIIQREGVHIAPLFVPCGPSKQELLQKELTRYGVPFDAMTVYETAKHPHMKDNLTTYFAEKGTPACIAFFSPSGVKHSLHLVERLTVGNLRDINFAAIGPTTRDAMIAEGLNVACTAEKPTAAKLAAAIVKVLK